MPRKAKPGKKNGKETACFRGGLLLASVGCWLDETRMELERRTAGGRVRAGDVRFLLDAVARDARRAAKALPAVDKEVRHIAETAEAWHGELGMDLMPPELRRTLRNDVRGMKDRLRPIILGAVKSCGRPDATERTLSEIVFGKKG